MDNDDIGVLLYLHLLIPSLLFPSSLSLPLSSPVFHSLLVWSPPLFPLLFYFPPFFLFCLFLSLSAGKKTLGGDTKSSLFYILIRDYGALEATKSMTRLSKLCARFLGKSVKKKKDRKEERKKGGGEEERKERRKEGRKEGEKEARKKRRKEER